MPSRVSQRLLATVTALAVMPAVGCMSLSPQLAPTDYEALEKLEDRGEREEAYAANAIYAHQEPQGTRYTKGTGPSTTKRSWQSLDAVLRSDENASMALPAKKLRLARVFTALAVIGAVAVVAGAAASAREGLDLKRMTGPAGVMLGGGIAAVGFGVTAGILYGQSKKGYENAVDIYNDSLGMRLGVLSPGGKFVPPRGVLVDAEGYVVLDNNEAALQRGSEAKAQPAQPTPAQPPPAEPAPAEPDPSETPTEAAPGKAPLEAPPGAGKPPVQRPTSTPDGGGLALRPRG